MRASAYSPSPALRYRQNLPEYRDSSQRYLFAGEHATEFQLRQLLFQPSSTATASLRFLRRRLTASSTARNIFETLRHLIQRIYDGFRERSLAPERAQVRSDIRLFQLGVHFFETLFLGIVVKNAP